MPDIVNTELDMSQPDGLPKEQPRDEAGRFTKPEESAPKHPQGLVELARDFGFSDDEIGELSTSGLSAAIRRVRAVQEATRSQFAQAELVTKPAPIPEPELDLGLNAEEYDEKVVNAFNKLKARDAETSRALKELREELAQTRKANEDRDSRETARLIDDAIEALGPDYESYFGKGSGYDLKDSDPQAYTRRIKFLRLLDVDPRRASGKQLMAAIKSEAEQLMPKAKKAEENPYEQKPANGGPTRAQWDRGGTAIPTQRNGASEPKGAALARRNLEVTMREKGLNTSSEDREIYDTLPKR